MSDDKQGLDSFLTTETSAPKEESQAVNLEDEFAKLLNNFITDNAENKEVTQPEQSSTPATGGLEGFISQPQQEAPTTSGLDGFISQSQPEATGLDSFLTPFEEKQPTRNEAPVQETQSLDTLITNVEVPAPVAVSETENSENPMHSEEQELARAVTNFQDGVYALADKKNLKMPQTDYTNEMLIPNYKPSVGKKIAQYLLACWDLINKYDPENMSRLSPEANDEEYLTFAESLSDTDMQLSIISYVEILINMEICEVQYEQKRELALKNRIKKELYEEYMELQERKNTFKQKLKEKNFPIDTDKLIDNYFRAAQKDAEGAFQALTKNPAMFSPIQFEKMHPRFFGLIKVTPEDGIKANQKIGEFIKKLKV
ncbi:MAG: hypothetical protein J6C85_00395 [Alphaproteobacteria bacterium]|nr:hypothetical protein [Alphaproteobacteria bacterium]